MSSITDQTAASIDETAAPMDHRAMFARCMRILAASAEADLAEIEAKEPGDITEDDEATVVLLGVLHLAASIAESLEVLACAKRAEMRAPGLPPLATLPTRRDIPSVDEYERAALRHTVLSCGCSAD